MSIEVDEAYFDIRTWDCVVEKCANVSTLIREIVLRLPEGEPMAFRAGGFVEVTSPPFRLEFSDIEIEAEYRDVWDRMNLWRLKAGSDVEVTRSPLLGEHTVEILTEVLGYSDDELQTVIDSGAVGEIKPIAAE